MQIVQQRAVWSRYSGGRDSGGETSSIKWSSLISNRLLHWGSKPRSSSHKTTLAPARSQVRPLSRAPITKIFFLSGAKSISQMILDGLIYKWFIYKSSFSSTDLKIWSISWQYSTSLFSLKSRETIKLSLELVNNAGLCWIFAWMFSQVKREG